MHRYSRSQHKIYEVFVCLFLDDRENYSLVVTDGYRRGPNTKNIQLPHCISLLSFAISPTSYSLGSYATTGVAEIQTRGKQRHDPKL